jgi:hypothetical protein
MANPEEFQADPPPDPPRPVPEPPRRRFQEDDDEFYRNPDDPVATIIPYTNPKALIAYYCGVFALIPCAGALLGPVALVLGILGLSYVKQHPTAKGTGHAIAGIVLGSLALLFNWGAILFFVVAMMMAPTRR